MRRSCRCMADERAWRGGIERGGQLPHLHRVEVMGDGGEHRGLALERLLMAVERIAIGQLAGIEVADMRPVACQISARDEPCAARSGCEGPLRSVDESSRD